MFWVVFWVSFLAFEAPVVFGYGCDFPFGCTDSFHPWNPPEQISNDLIQLIASYTSGKITSQVCHLQAHTLGQRAFEDTGLALLRLPEAHACRSGFIHGLFEKAVDGADFSSLGALCPEYGFGPMAMRLNCLHGVGHGLYARLENVTASLDFCRAWNSSWQTQACATGVFMDAFQGGHGNRPADRNDPDPMVFCNRFDFREQCFLYSVISWQRRQSGLVSIASCRAVQKHFMNACHQGVGAFSAKWGNYESVSIQSACQQNRECLQAAAFESGFSGETIKGAKLCLSLGMAGVPSCLAKVGSGYFLNVG